jgi:hypothetical protein
LEKSIIRQDFMQQFRCLNSLFLYAIINRDYLTAERLSDMIQVAYSETWYGASNWNRELSAEHFVEAEMFADIARQNYFLALILFKEKHSQDFDSTILTLDVLESYRVPPFYDVTLIDISLLIKDLALRTKGILKDCKSKNAKKYLAITYSILTFAYSTLMRCPTPYCEDCLVNFMKCFLAAAQYEYHTEAGYAIAKYAGAKGSAGIYGMWLAMLNSITTWLYSYLDPFLRTFDPTVDNSQCDAQLFEVCIAEQVGWTPAQVRRYFVHIRNSIGAKTDKYNERELKFLDEAKQVLLAPDAMTRNLQYWRFDAEQGWVSVYQPTDPSKLVYRHPGYNSTALTRWLFGWASYKT